MEQTTYDGQPIAREAPFGASVVVYRGTAGGPEFLILHRAHQGAAFEGDWAWTPPAGARWPGEVLQACAQRELFEETGLRIAVSAACDGAGDWCVFMAEASPEAEIVLNDEHDRFAWLGLAEAMARCAPATVADQLRLVSQRLG